MHFRFSNVNDAFSGLVRAFYSAGLGEEKGGGIELPEGTSAHLRSRIVQRPSRNGPTLLIEEPCTITYQRPLQRVLFNRTRDCNPFFHVFESLWMLAGRNDIAPLRTYISTYDFSDDGRTQNGAYGYRWRRASNGHCDHCEDEREVDQLKILADHLKADPDSRRAVLQMWNVEDDLLKIGSLHPCKAAGKGCVNGKWENWKGRALIDGPCPICKGTGFEPASKDVCCNLSVMFSIRKVHEEVDTGGFDPQGSPINDGVTTSYLDMTVTNRSNDLIWGMLGANVVHFSFLQEYMAARLGVEVGVYNQFTNNLHVYCARKDYKPKEWSDDRTVNAYKTGEVNVMVPLVENADRFDHEVVRFIDVSWGDANPKAPGWHGFEEPFLERVASPMCRAFYFHKERDYGAALHWCSQIESDDWRIAATHWIMKRRDNYYNSKAREEEVQADD